MKVFFYLKNGTIITTDNVESLSVKRDNTTACSGYDIKWKSAADRDIIYVNVNEIVAVTTAEE